MIINPTKSILCKISLLLVCMTLIQCESEPAMVHFRYINESFNNIDTFVVDNTVLYTTQSSFIVDFKVGDTSVYSNFEDSHYIPFDLHAKSGSKKFYSYFRYGTYDDGDSSSIYGTGYYDVIIEDLDTMNYSIAFSISKK